MSKHELFVRAGRGPLPRQKAAKFGDRRLKRLKTRGNQCRESIQRGS